MTADLLAPESSFMVIEATKEDSRASKSAVTRIAKARVQAADTTARLSHTTGLVVQGQTVREFEGKDASTWSSVVLSLSKKSVPVCPQCFLEHPASQQEPVPVEEVAITFMPPMWSEIEPALHNETLSCSSS